MKIHDISIPISAQMPIYPGDPVVQITPKLEIARGDAANVSQLSMGDHSGTHLDPPVHFVPGGLTVDRLDLQTLYGPVQVVDLAHVRETISATDLEGMKLPAGAVRIIFKTRNSELWDRSEFVSDYVGVGWDAARWLVEHGIRLVGIDYLSIESYHASEPNSHRILLGAGVIVVEGLDLRRVRPGGYTLACFPLKIRDGDGGPVRAVLIED